MKTGREVLDELIAVCSACKRASCWQGFFYCDEYKTAGTVDLTIKELENLGLEDPSFWKEDSNVDQPPTLDEAMDLARNELDLWESPIVPSNSIFIGEEVQRLLDSNKQVIDAYDKHVERRGNEKARRIYCHWCGLPIKVKEGG